MLCPCRLLTEKAELPFCVDGSWASGARVERDGSGLFQVWSKQIQQLNRVSPAVASTVTAAYPSPQLLLQVYLIRRQYGPLWLVYVLNQFLNSLSVLGIPAFGIRGGEERAAGWFVSKKWRQRQTYRTRSVIQSLSLPHGPEPPAGPGLNTGTAGCHAGLTWFPMTPHHLMC